MQRVRSAIGLLLMVLAVSGCAGAQASPPAATASPPPAASATAEPTERADVAPEELQGAWEATNGDQVTLTILRTGYQVDRGFGFGRGNISVDGDEILFSGSDLCEGAGTYIWQIEDGVLTFTPVDDDPCGGRRAILIDRLYERQS
jgi:Rieske Fe-S protein